jgi:hypothetical protein
MLPTDFGLAWPGYNALIKQKSGKTFLTKEKSEEIICEVVCKEGLPDK